MRIEVLDSRSTVADIYIFYVSIQSPPNPEVGTILVLTLQLRGSGLRFMNHLFTEPRFARAAVLLTPCPTPVPNSPVLDQELVDKKLLLKLLYGCKFKWGWGGDPSRQRGGTGRSPQSSEREIDRPQQGGKRISNHREIPICSFFVWQTWCQVLKVYHVPLLHSHPRGRDHHLHVRDGKQCCYIPSPPCRCQDVLVECTTCQALGKGPDAHFLHKSRVRTVSSILQMRLLLGKVFSSPPFRPPNLGSPILTL